MRHNHKRFIALIAILATLSACGKEEPINNPSGGKETTPEVTISTNSQSLSSDGGNATIAFSSTGAWTATTNVDWITLSQVSGNSGSVSITMSVKENGEYDQREGLVVISSGNVSKGITVTQKQKDALLLTSNTIFLDDAGGTPTIEVKANVEYSCKVDDDAKSWISIVSTRALTTSNIKLSISENTGSSDRQGNVIVYSGDKTEVVTVYQKASTRSSTTSLAGTSWCYKFQGSSSTNSETYYLICSFRADGTFIQTYKTEYYSGGGNFSYQYGTYESKGEKYSLTYQGYISKSESPNYSDDPPKRTAEIIGDVLYIFNGSVLEYFLFKI